MNFDKLNQWLSLIANVGVVVGIFFLAMEIRSNTASNRIAIQSAFSTNWVSINGGIAENPELAAVIEKAIVGEELNDVERRQLNHFVRQHASQANLMRRLFAEGFATVDDVRNAYSGLRRYAVYERFREEIEELSERNQRIILEEDGLEKWLNTLD